MWGGSHKKIYWSVNLELGVCAAFSGAVAILEFILGAGKAPKSLTPAPEQNLVLKWPHGKEKYAKGKCSLL